MKVTFTKKQRKKMLAFLLLEHFSIDMNDLLKWGEVNAQRVKNPVFLQDYLNDKYPENVKPNGTNA